MVFFRIDGYSRNKAVSYATTYALKPNPAYRYFPLINSNTSGDCANFLSQCLHAGGVPMNHSSRNPWWYNMNKFSRAYDTWSISWTVAHSLFWLLKINAEANLSGAKGIEVNNTNLLEIGDLVFFEDSRGVIFHSAIVTSFYNGQILISHHSFEALNIPIQKTWPYSKIHYLKIKL